MEETRLTQKNPTKLIDESCGKLTRAEILSEPACWSECLSILDRENYLPKMRQTLAGEGDWLIIGCGSSYYAAQAAAASWTVLTGERALAAPASEVLLFPDLVVPESRRWRPVLISRSGNTSEVLKVAEYVEKARNLRVLAVSCV